MKKSILMLAIAGTAMFLMPSCKKAETLLTPTENATVAQGATYTYAMPTSTYDAFEITTQPAHGSISILGVDSLGALIYKYVPDATYIGTDKVVLSTVEGSQAGPRPALDSTKHCPKDSSMQGPPRDSTKCPPHPKGPRPPKHGKCDKNEVRNDYVITINFNVVPK